MMIRTNICRYIPTRCNFFVITLSISWVGRIFGSEIGAGRKSEGEPLFAFLRAPYPLQKFRARRRWPAGCVCFAFRALFLS